QETTERVARIAYTLDDPTPGEIEALVQGQLGMTLAGTFTPQVTFTQKYGQTYANIEILYQLVPYIPFVGNMDYSTRVSSEVLVRDLP
ncbi:MAG: hypothetical protein CMK07_11400, partial [Ponticaulis sp.]|nr:hypothetical protein [Ponticaulis sp.]